MTRRLGQTDIHPGQAACLGILAHRDGISQRDLAEALRIAPPTLSRMLQSMEKNGLVERRDDESDQRLSRVYVTAAGRAVSREMQAAMAGHITAALAALSEDERVELARLLDRLSASILRSLDDDTDAGVPGAGRHVDASGGRPDAEAAGWTREGVPR